MLNQYSRTELLFGKDAMERLWRSRVAVFGIGGVGGYTVEALVRSGIGTVDLIDDDRICLTNINRQLYATRKTVGKYKVDVAAERIAEINPQVTVNLHQTFFGPNTAEEFDFSSYDYVVDAIDTVTGKIALVMQAQDAGTPIISSMGAGNKVDPTAFRVADIYETKVCPLARVMRRELKKRGVKALKVVYSREADADRRYGNQLPRPLYLPAGHGQKMYPTTAGSWQQRLCAVRRRPDHCRRSDQGFGRLSGKTRHQFLNMGKPAERPMCERSAKHEIYSDQRHDPGGTHPNRPRGLVGQLRDRL